MGIHSVSRLRGSIDPNEVLPSDEEVDKSFVTNFKFSCELFPPQNQPGGGAAYDGINLRGGGGNWRKDHNNKSSSRNWRNDRDDHNLDQNQVNWIETGGNGCPMARGRHNSGG